MKLIIFKLRDPFSLLELFFFDTPDACFAQQKSKHLKV